MCLPDKIQDIQLEWILSKTITFFSISLFQILHGTYTKKQFFPDCPVFLFAKFDNPRQEVSGEKKSVGHN